MRLLVTGGAGFIGSHVVDAYVQAGHEVVVADNLSTGRRENVNPRADFFEVDLNSPRLAELFQTRAFDVVNHHAAQVDVRRSVADPVSDAAVNITGTIRLLELCRQHRVRGVVFVSSGGAIYGEHAPIPTPEDAPARPLSPYGITKLAGERYVDYYQMVHGIPAVILRYANVFGPRQDPHGEAGVVAIFCQRLLKGEVPVVFGDGEQTRDFVYVGDVARANLLALRHLGGVIESVESIEAVESAGSRQLAAGSELGTARCEPPTPPRTARRSGDRRTAEQPNSRTAERSFSSLFNIGTGIETTVNALLAHVATLAGGGPSPQHEPPRAGEQRRSAVDPTRAGVGLAWSPATPLAEGLALTLEWFKKRQSARQSATSGQPLTPS